MRSLCMRDTKMQNDHTERELRELKGALQDLQRESCSRKEELENEQAKIANLVYHQSGEIGSLL